MSKYDLIFRISFINYLLVLIAMPYITARTWADIILLVFILSCIYQFTYIIYFRKKDGLKISTSIANWFLYITYIMDILVIYFLIDIIFALGNIGGLEGVVLMIIGLPIYVIAIIYKIIYYRIIKRKSNNIKNNN